MAEFGIQATDLSAPQGAGASPVAPVTAGILDNGVGENIGNIMSIFQKGLEHDAKAKKEEMKNRILGEYAREMGAVSDAASSGVLKPDAVARRSRAIHNKYVSSFAEYYQEFKGLRSTFMEGTESGVALDEETAARKSRESLINTMIGKGYPVAMDSPKAVQDAWIGVHQATQRADEEEQRKIRRASEFRAQTKFEQESEALADKKKAEVLINDLASENLNALFTTAQDYGTKIRTGGMNADEARFNLESQFSKIDQTIGMIGAKNPELAGYIRGTFKDAREAALKFMDPKTSAEDAQNLYNAAIAKQKLLAITLDPTVANAVAVTEMFKGAPDVAMSTLGRGSRALEVLGAWSQGKPTPSVIGTKDEKPTLDFIKDSLKRLNTGQTKDAPKLKEEITNSVRQYLSQAGKTNGQGMTAKDFQPFAEFVESSDFGKFVSENPLNKEEIEPVKYVYQQTYEGPAVKAVDDILQKQVITSTGLVPNRAATGAKLEPKSELVADRIGVSFDGSSVKFFVKDGTGRAGAAAGSSTDELNQSAQAINKLIRRGAHLNGTTDYNKYFEEHKHILLPRLFSAYEGLEIGQVVNGKRYIGGDPNVGTNWK